MSETVVNTDTVQLDPEDVAVIFKPSTVNLVTPLSNEHKEIAYNVEFAVMVAHLASIDKQWVEDTINRFEKVNALPVSGDKH